MKYSSLQLAVTITCITKYLPAFNVPQGWVAGDLPLLGDIPRTTPCQGYAMLCCALPGAALDPALPQASIHILQLPHKRWGIT